MLINTREYLEGRKCIQISQDSFNDELIKDLRNDKRIVCITTSRSDGEELTRILNKEFPDKFIKFYDRDCDKSELKDVNEVWSRCDCIVYTPVIQTGISYMSNSFDLCYANLKPTNLARDAMQMLLRCRELKDNLVKFSLGKRQIYNTENIQMFETYESFDNDRVNKTNILIQELDESHTNDSKLIDLLKNSLKTTDKSLLRTMWHNLREHMLSHCHYNSMVIYLLKKQGYELSLLDAEDNHEKKNEKTEMDYMEEYSKIKPINPEDVEKLKNRDVSRDDRLRIDKYFFENMTVKELDEGIKGRLFYEYYQKSYNKQYLENIKYEKSNIDSPTLIQKELVNNDFLVNKMKMINKKKQIVKQVNELIGLNHSCDSEKVIEKSIIVSKVLKFMKENIE